MIRLMKADFYRLFHSKGFYLILLTTIGVAGVIVASNFISIAVGITNEETSGAIDTVLTTYKTMKWNPELALKGSLSVSPILNYLFIGFFITISGYEFSQKTYKNTLTSGVSRITFILSKYFTQLLSVLLGTALYLGSTVIFSLIKFGITDVNIVELLKNAGFATLSLAFCISVILSLANILLISFTSSVLPTAFIVIYPFLIQIIGLVTNWSGIQYFDLLSTVQRMATNELYGNALIPYILVCLALVVGSIVVSAGVMKKKEF